MAEIKVSGVSWIPPILPTWFTGSRFTTQIKAARLSQGT